MIYKDTLDTDLYPVVFADCIPVKGVVRSIIYDFSRNRYTYIPNILFEILFDNTKNIRQLISVYGNENKKYIIDYFKFLIDKNFLFFSQSPESFPKLNLDFETPSEITNVILDIAVSMPMSQHYKSAIEILSEKLGSKYFQLRIYDDIGLENLKELLGFFVDTKVVSIEIVLKYSNKFVHNDIEQILEECPRITNLVFHSVSKDISLKKTGLLQSSYPIHFSSEIINSCEQCGIISNNHFSVDIQTYTESQSLNSCLNKKVSIDIEGNIKNCPSMQKSYGNITNTNIEDIIKLKEFKYLWSISKAQIDVCKDCEYRFMCTDCRAYIKNSNDLYSQPLKCNYNPYIAKWEAEEGYISVKQWRTENPDWKNNIS